MKVTKIYFVFIWLICGCAQSASTKYESGPANIIGSACDTLSVTVSQIDTFDYERDSQYGVGDDDLFMANQPKVYLVSNGKAKNLAKSLDDYNLTTSADLIMGPSHPDTLILVVEFPGLNSNISKDTLAMINSIGIYNGKRKSNIDWEKSGKIKNIEVFHNKTFEGYATLLNTYKYQSVNFKKPVILNRGRIDTFSIIVKSTYSKKLLSGEQYSISEIKLEGEKKY